MTPNFKKLVEHLPSLNGPLDQHFDRESLASFLEGRKPACVLTHYIREDMVVKIAKLAMEYLPDADFIQNPKNGEQMLFSPSAIEKRKKDESSVAEWLSIANDDIETILQKSFSNEIIRGFILGYPYSALKTWSRKKGIERHAMTIANFCTGEAMRLATYSTWEASDRQDYQSLVHAFTLTKDPSHQFLNQSGIASIVRRIYRKYFALHDSDIDFLLSLRWVNEDGIRYMDSTQFVSKAELIRREIAAKAKREESE